MGQIKNIKLHIVTDIKELPIKTQVDINEEITMVTKQRMRLANEKHADNVSLRGNVPKSLNPTDDRYAVGPCLLALFLFVVLGSFVFEIVNIFRQRYGF